MYYKTSQDNSALSDVADVLCIAVYIAISYYSYNSGVSPLCSGFIRGQEGEVPLTVSFKPGYIEGALLVIVSTHTHNPTHAHT